MKKSEQLAINAQVLDFMREVPDLVTALNIHEWRQLRSCSAEVANVGCYLVLKSYNNVVAIIDKRTDTLYDFLRSVYGYTSASAQHISKFSKDYGMGKWGCAHYLTYREV